MKLLIAILILAVVGSTRAEEIYFAFKAKPGNTCAWYQGTFASAGYAGVRNGAKPTIACKLQDEDDSVVCLVENHGLTKLNPVLEFRGDFDIVGDTVRIRANETKLSIRAACDRESGCYLFQMWNRNSLMGYACDTVSHVEPKPKSKPPALLSPNAAPYKAPESKVLSF